MGLNKRKKDGSCVAAAPDGVGRMIAYLGNNRFVFISDTVTLYADAKGISSHLRQIGLAIKFVRELISNLREMLRYAVKHSLPVAFVGIPSESQSTH
jgi:hypothetical protein